MQLKGFISRCRFFIGARTHATIAAYSTCVPTLVMGYSTKSRGIATDLFGTDDHYVLPVQELTAPEALTDAFRWIMEREQEIRSRLEAVMPEYITRAKGVKENVEAALKKV
jgi:polysaccharide pyruvyl transferase WcaK-like protein